MSTIIVTIGVELQNNGECTRKLAADFEARINDMLEEGAITGETEAEVIRRVVRVHYTE